MEPVTSISVPLHARLSNKIFWCNESTLSVSIGEECYAFEIKESAPKRQLENAPIIHMNFLKNIQYEKDPVDCAVPLSRLLKESSKSFHKAEKFLMDTVCCPRIRNTDNHLLYRQTIMVPKGVFTGLALFTHDQFLKFHHFPNDLDTTSTGQQMNTLLYLYIQNNPHEFDLNPVELAHTVNITHYAVSSVIHQNNQRSIYVALINRYGSIFVCKTTGWIFEEEDITVVRTSGDLVPSSILWLRGDSQRGLTFVIGYGNGKMDIVELKMNEDGSLCSKIERYLDEDYRRIDNIAYDPVTDTLAVSKHKTVLTCNLYGVVTGEHNFNMTKYDLSDIAICSDKMIVCTTDNQVQVKNLKTNRMSTLESTTSKITQNISVDISVNGSLLAVLFRTRIKDIYRHFYHSQIVIYALKELSTLLDKHWNMSDNIKLSINSLPYDDMIALHSCLTRQAVPDFIKKHIDSDEQWKLLNEHQIRVLISITQFLIHTTANIKIELTYHTNLKKQLVKLRVNLYERIVKSHPSSFGFLQERYGSTQLNELSEQFSIPSNHTCELCETPFSLTYNLNLRCENGHTIPMCVERLSPIYEGEPHYFCDQCNTATIVETGEYILVPCIFCTKLMTISIIK